MAQREARTSSILGEQGNYDLSAQPGRRNDVSLLTTLYYLLLSSLTHNKSKVRQICGHFIYECVTLLISLGLVHISKHIVVEFLNISHSLLTDIHISVILHL